MPHRRSRREEEHGNLSELPRFTWKSKISILGISVLAALLTAEIAIRIFFPSATETQRIQEEIRRNFSMEGLARPSMNAELRYELVPGSYRQWGQVVVATHPFEPIRISTLAPPPAQPAFRIALIGDSTPFGHGLFYESSYASTLRTELERNYNIPIEIRNYSLSGYNATQVRATYTNLVAPWKPDLLLLHYDHNDAEPNTYPLIPPHYGDNILNSDLIRLALRRLRGIVWRFQHFYFYDRASGSRASHDDYISSGPAYDLHLSELHRIGRSARKANLPAVAIISDWRLSSHGFPADDPHYNILHAPLLPRLEKEGFKVLDLYPHFQDLMREKNWSGLDAFELHPLDRAHPNARGHAFIAKHLYDYITREPDLSGLLENIAARSEPPATPLTFEAITIYREGLLSLERKQLEKAERSFHRTLAFKPLHLEAKINLALTLQQQDRHTEAAAEYAAVLAKKSDLPIVRYRYAESLIEVGKPLDAMDQFNLLLRSRLKDSVIKASLDRLYEVASTLDGETVPEGVVESVRRAADHARAADRTEHVAELEALAERLSRAPTAN